MTTVLKTLSAEEVPTFRERLRRLPLWAKLWWWTGLGLFAGTVLLTSVASGSCFAVFFTVLFVLWTLPTAFWVLYQLWLKLTYRISVRLLLSYLLIGVLPFPMILVLLLIGVYALIGQYTADHFDGVGARVREELGYVAAEAVAAAGEGGAEAARAVLERGPRLPEKLAGLGEQVEWILLAGEDVRTSPGAAELPLPRRTSDVVERSAYSLPGFLAWGAVVRRDEVTAAVLLPALPELSGHLSRKLWYEVTFLDDEVAVNDRGVNVSLSSRDGATGEDEPATPEDDDPEVRSLVHLWSSRIAYFLHLDELRRWEDGSVLGRENGLVTLVRTSAREAMKNLSGGRVEISGEVWGAVLGISILFLVAYLVALSLAVIQIFSITRSTARLTRGTRHVQAGELDYRIPVRRRDQLGDLAVAFNQMMTSIEGMLEDVAEKERLKGELELAREIQESLLPARHLRHEPFSVYAYFRPAAEVGGDYFDLFPLEPGRLIVAAGDVAGHGLPTGLLMAMVKSAVATLIQEGHRGAGLMERLNHFMLQQPRGHRMVTLTLADVDTNTSTVEITNAAHPPVLITGGGVREVLLPALPLGFPWRDTPPSKRLDLEPDSRLVFYSDGLVEAVGEGDEQYGYERLRTFLEDNAELASEELLEALLADLECHTGGRPLDDDLTVLVIDCGKAGEKTNGDPP